METESKEIKTEINVEVGDYKIHSSIPVNVFKQQDLYVLLMLWHRESKMETWASIRKVAIENSVVYDNAGVKMKPEELPLKILDTLVNGYVEMALSFFISRLA